MVLGDPGEGIADELHPPPLEVLDAAEIVENLARDGIGEQRVDGEVAPRRVLAPVLGVRDGRPAAVGGDVAAQRRHLDRRAVDDGGDGAVGEARRHRLDLRLREPRDHLLGRQPGGEVDVVDLELEQGVADAAADEARLALRRAKRAQQPRHPRPRPPSRFRQLHAGSSGSSGASRRLRLTIIAAVAPQIRRPSHSIS
jgi:hypothetical protein